MAPHNITSSSSRIDDGSSQGTGMSLPEHLTCTQAELPCGTPDHGQVTVDRLPDNVLLEIFDLCRPQYDHGVSRIYNLLHWFIIWNMLTPVCRRWRCIILGSPRRLQLQVICTPTTPTKMLPDIWPPFPIAICCYLEVYQRSVKKLIAPIKHRDHISEIQILSMKAPALKRLIRAMHEPLPALTHFCLGSDDEPVSVLPETFLGGSAPHLQSFVLQGIPFPTFPKFILSATNIVRLQLLDIPNVEYVTPEVMATCLSALPKLNYLHLNFRSPPTRHLHVGLPPLSRAVLPALGTLVFKGASEYFEDFVARTHIPLLKFLYMNFFKDLMYHIPRTHELIDRVEAFRLLGRASVMFASDRILMMLGSPPTQIQLDIRCEKQDRGLSLLAHACGKHLPPSNVERLTIRELFPDNLLYWKDNMDISQWLELFHSFVAVRDLYVTKKFVPFVTGALQELTGERNMEVLPVLNNLFLEGLETPGPVQEVINPFISARLLSNHPIVIHSNIPQTS